MVISKGSIIDLYEYFGIFSIWESQAQFLDQIEYIKIPNQLVESNEHIERIQTMISRFFFWKIRIDNIEHM